MPEQAETVAVRQAVVVEAPRERAWTVFTEGIDSWWPETHTLGGTPPVVEVIEPRVGGRLYDRDADGRELDWGRVLVWEPPERFVFSWQIAADFTYDASIDTTVEVRFTAEGPARTRVELEHRGLEAYGAETERMRGLFGGEGGWPTLLELFAAEAARGERVSGRGARRA